MHSLQGLIPKVIRNLLDLQVVIPGHPALEAAGPHQEPAPYPPHQGLEEAAPEEAGRPARVQGEEGRKIISSGIPTGGVAGKC